MDGGFPPRSVRRRAEVRPRRRFGWWWVPVAAVVLAAAATFGMSVYVGWNLTHPARKPVDDSPARLGLSFVNAEFPSAGEPGGAGVVTLRGWFVAAPGSDKSVILSHGYAGNRLEKDVPALELTRSLVKAGYNVLLFDFRNSGLSDGTLTSVGYFEVNDLLGAVRYLRTERPLAARHIGLVGFSMGAAVSALAAARDASVEAVVMDSPFADLEAYLRENMPVWTKLPDVPFTWMILHAIPLLEGVDPAQVSPLRVMPRLRQPVLLIHGEADSKIPFRDSQLLFKASQSGKVSLWVVPGADHVGSRKVRKEEYDRRVLEFFGRYLGG